MSSSMPPLILIPCTILLQSDSTATTSMFYPRNSMWYSNSCIPFRDSQVPQEWLAEHTKHVANMDHNLGARQIGKRDSKGDARDD